MIWIDIWYVVLWRNVIYYIMILFATYDGLRNDMTLYYTKDNDTQSGMYSVTYKYHDKQVSLVNRQAPIIASSNYTLTYR